MSPSSNKSYAIIPAAGRSARMGTHKLLLDWPYPAGFEVAGEEHSPTDGDACRKWTVLDAVLSAWQHSKVDQFVIVLRDFDESSAGALGVERQLVGICSKYRVHVTFAQDPPDMKASVVVGLRFLMDHFSPRPSDRCLVAPADLPTISSRLINQIIVSSELDDESDRVHEVVVPNFAGKAGHPVSFPWMLLQEIESLSADQGLNSLVESSKRTTLEFSKEAIERDLNTPLDYANLLKAVEKRSKQRGDQHF